MEKRSRRRTRDLVTQAASQGLSENEIGCARISMMARSTNAPCKGRIQMRKTNPLHLLKFGLQRTAGPYSWVKTGKLAASNVFRCSPNNGLASDIAACPFVPKPEVPNLFDHLVGAGEQCWRDIEPKRLRSFEVMTRSNLVGCLTGSGADCIGDSKAG